MSFMWPKIYSKYLELWNLPQHGPPYSIFDNSLE